MRPYACLQPSRHARSLRDCSDSLRCDSLCTCAARAVRDVLERRHRSVVVAPATLALGASRCTWLQMPPFRCAASCSSTRALTTRSRRTLCCIASRGRVRCLSSVLACVHGLHMPRHPVRGPGSRVLCLLAGSAPALVHGGSSTSAQGVQRIHLSSPTSRSRGGASVRH